MSIMRFDVLTLFPRLFDGFLSQSIVKRAVEAGKVEINLWNPRDWSQDKHHQVDDRPFGGGPGMVLMAPPIVDAVEDVRGRDSNPGLLIALTPQGQKLDQALVRELAKKTRHILLCGRYEGFDERIIEILNPLEVSIGDYILSGGEVAAMVVMDAVSRLVPGVLGDETSALDDSFGPDGGIEHPQYTRPRAFRGLEVPEVLLSGDHSAIELWRRDQSRRRTDRRLERLEGKSASRQSDDKFIQ